MQPDHAWFKNPDLILCLYPNSSQLTYPANHCLPIASIFVSCINTNVLFSGKMYFPPELLYQTTNWNWKVKPIVVSATTGRESVTYRNRKYHERVRPSVTQSDSWTVSSRQDTMDITAVFITLSESVSKTHVYIISDIFWKTYQNVLVLASLFFSPCDKLVEERQKKEVNLDITLDPLVTYRIEHIQQKCNTCSSTCPSFMIQ